MLQHPARRQLLAFSALATERVRRCELVPSVTPDARTCSVLAFDGRLIGGRARRGHVHSLHAVLEQERPRVIIGRAHRGKPRLYNRLRQRIVFEATRALPILFARHGHHAVATGICALIGAAFRVHPAAACRRHAPRRASRRSILMLRHCVTALHLLLADAQPRRHVAETGDDSRRRFVRRLASTDTVRQVIVTMIDTQDGIANQGRLIIPTAVNSSTPAMP